MGKYTIVQARALSEAVFEMWIHAPQVARHAKAGQFCIIHADGAGERVPLTISATKGGVAVGLLGEGITEVIAVTKDNAAPIGIIVRAGQAPKMILFKGSKTAENIAEYGWVTANFVSDSYLYPQYAFSDVAKSDLRKVFVGGMVMQLLRDADAWMAFTARVVNETKEAYFVELEPVGSEYCRDQLRPVNRGFNAVIDATVHATRYLMTHDPKLRDLIEYHLGIVRKCGGVRDIEAAALIKEVCGL